MFVVCLFLIGWVAVAAAAAVVVVVVAAAVVVVVMVMVGRYCYPHLAGKCSDRCPDVKSLWVLSIRTPALRALPAHTRLGGVPVPVGFLARCHCQ